VGIEHNLMALEVSSALLHQLRTGQATGWATQRLSNQSILWPGIADWPRPDIAFEDINTGATLALEFKPPNHSKREYVTGLGQMLTYLQDFEFSGLVLPERSSDGFEIAKFITDTVSSNLDDLPIMLLSYDKMASDFSVLRPLKARTTALPARSSRSGPRTFWAYWRDLSNFELFELLRIIDSSGKPDFSRDFQKFWKSFVLKKKARTWEGALRQKDPNSKVSPERINAFYAMRHSGLIDSEGRITLAGLTLLHVGKIYGPDSEAFLNLLARSILIDGRHLDLIFWIEDQTRQLGPSQKTTSTAYLAALDSRLAAAGVIAPRVKGASKANFIRDEPKLWNKLGLIEHKGSGSQYFQSGSGYLFNWRKILSVTGTEGGAF
jgi:hypothetical protein